ncbi:MAG: phytoene/squalene synthase family protein [Sporichthyaceae bacterium]
MSARRALDAAGIGDPHRRAADRGCRSLLARHGRTYSLATALLPPERRPYVWALYGFARHADDIVDDLDSHPTAAQRAELFGRWSAQRLSDLAAGTSEDPIGRALLDTLRTWDIDPGTVGAFLASMGADLTVNRYATFDDLMGYMHGSAAVIGLQMLPVLGPLHPDAAAPARALGIAFQLTNFVRDVDEDLRRGRLYLPLEDLAAHGVTRADLERRQTTEAVRNLVRFEVDRARTWYDRARPGLDLLRPDSRECIGTALRVYAGILEEIERGDYDVFAGRAVVSRRTRIRIAVPAYLRARRSWPNRSHQIQVHSTSAKPNSRSSTGA